MSLSPGPEALVPEALSAGSAAAEPQALAALVRLPGFTPPVSELSALLSLLYTADRDLAAAGMLAVRRMGVAVLPRLVVALPKATRPLRGRLTELIGRLAVLSGADLEQHTGLLCSLLDDSDLKTQINAAQALGRLRSKSAAAALLQALAAAPRRELQLALVRALGKGGGQAAEAMLAAHVGAQDEQIGRLAKRGVLIVQREQSRLVATEVAGDVALSASWRVRLHCRRGLEQLLVEEAAEQGFEAVASAPGVVEMTTAGALAPLRALRLVEHFGLLLPVRSAELGTAAAVALRSATPLLHKLTRAVAGPESTSPATLTAPPVVRYRLAWEGGSKAQLWDLAAGLTRDCPGLVNDPTSSPWELVISGSGAQLDLELRPKRLADKRFSYRHGFVPAASHPTLAAALCRVAKVRADEVIWDPFTGSGTELIECALSTGAPVALHGTDSNPDAVATATANLAAAGFKAELSCSDLTLFQTVRPTLIITNPPMGRRVQRGQLTAVLDRFVAHAVPLLAPGGRLVWLAPLALRTDPQLHRHGLQLVLAQKVDMGGFPAVLQRWEKAPGSVG